MELTEKQFQMLRAPFEESGALKGYSEEQIKTLLEQIAEIYITLAEINLRSKQKRK